MKAEPTKADTGMKKAKNSTQQKAKKLKKHKKHKAKKEAAKAEAAKAKRAPRLERPPSNGGCKTPWPPHARLPRDVRIVAKCRASCPQDLSARSVAAPANVGVAYDHRLRRLPP